MKKAHDFVQLHFALHHVYKSKYSSFFTRTSSTFLSNCRTNFLLATPVNFGHFKCKLDLVLHLGIRRYFTSQYTNPIGRHPHTKVRRHRMTSSCTQPYNLNKSNFSHDLMEIEKEKNNIFNYISWDICFRAKVHMSTQHTHEFLFQDRPTMFFKSAIQIVFRCVLVAESTEVPQLAASALIVSPLPQ